MTNASPQTPRHFIADNFGWLIGSVVLAVVVWFAAQNQQNPVEQQQFASSIPVQVLKDSTMLVVDQPQPVRVVLRAPHTVWEALDANDISVSADLRGKTAGVYTVPLSAVLSANRLGVVSEIRPGQVTVTLAKRSEQAFTINVTPTADPPVGFYVVGSKTTESSAKVSGSEAQVKLVTAVVARINLSDTNKAVTRVLDLVAVDGEGSTVPDVVVTPQQVTATIDVEPRPGVRVLKVVPSLMNATLPQGYVLSNYSSVPVNVALRGDLSTIESMHDSVSTEPINLTNKTASFTQTVKLALPAGVTLTDPVNIVVSITIDPINVTRTFDNILVQTQGLDSADFAITTKPDHVSVIVTGPQPVLDALQAADITVIAPLSELGSGTYTITLQAAVAHAGLTSDNLRIPNNQVQVTIAALHPTPTPTASPIPSATLLPTASVTP